MPIRIATSRATSNIWHSSRSDTRATNTSLDQEYRANYELYRAYVEFQNDSAQKYMRRNIDIARQLGDKTKESESTLNLMHLLNKAYLLDEVSMIARLPST